MVNESLRSTLSGALVAVLVSAPAGAMPKNELGLGVVRVLAQSMDQNRVGEITSREYRAFTETARVSIDYSDDSNIDKREFVAWDIGFRTLLEQNNNNVSFLIAKSDVFDHWDQDLDGNISAQEIAHLAETEFILADSVGDDRTAADDIARGLFTVATMLSAVS